jgi:hypothetical protein
MVLYIERWLKAPVQEEDGQLVPREKGTPQGGVISPLLANLFLHYAFDRWPDDIRFQILYRFLFRFLSKSAIVCSSTPAAPWFAFTRLYASQTSHLEIQNGFASLIGSSHCWLAH